MSDPVCEKCGRAHPPGVACELFGKAPVGETLLRPAQPQTRDAVARPAPVPSASPETQVRAGVPETMAGAVPPTAEKLAFQPPLAAPRPGALTRPPTPEPYAPTPPPEQLLGEMVGSFKLVRLLGKGGMGAVFLGEHPSIGSKVAIKMLHPMLATRPELVKRFYDEARAVNLIGHENIVSIFDLNQLNPHRYYIVMEYLDGQTLAQLMKDTRLTLEQSTDILLQLCDALAMAHARGIIHRDLKPENIFITKRGTREHFVKLVDFGIAKLRDETGGANETGTGILVGTPEYMSPEQADNKPVDARSDLYSLAVLAYRLVAGRLPFQEASIGRLIAAHLQKTPPPPREFNPSLPPAYEAALLKTLAKDPEDRIQDAMAFAEALREALKKPPTGGHVVIAAPMSQAEQPRVVADFEVEVVSPPPSMHLRAADVSRGGLFLCTALALPPLFSKVKLLLPNPKGGRFEVSGEVVRHVAPGEAQAWGMQPGFGVQFVGLSADQRALVGELTAYRPAASAVPPRPQTGGSADPEVRGVLRYLAERFNANHYDLLGLPQDAEAKQVPPAAKALDDRLRKAMAKAEPQYEAQLQAGLDRVKTAQEVLQSPVRRVDYDAHRGNFRGVARCIEAGLSQPDLAARHKAFLAQRPGLEERSLQMLGRIKLARGRGNFEAAQREFETALTQDPLNPELQRGWQELNRQLAGATPKPK